MTGGAGSHRSFLKRKGFFTWVLKDEQEFNPKMKQWHSRHERREHHSVGRQTGKEWISGTTNTITEHNHYRSPY